MRMLPPVTSCPPKRLMPSRCPCEYSHGQRLGIKRFGGQLVTGGSILIRQRGTRYKAGRNVSRAKDDSLFATITGVVRFEDKGAHGKFISVFPAEESAVGGADR